MNKDKIDSRFTIENVRIANLKTVYDCIRSRKATTRSELSKLTGLSLPSITRIVNALTEIGYVASNGLKSDGLGRKTVTMTAVSSVGYTIGVQIDKKFIRIGIIDFANNIIARDKVPYDCYLNSAKAVIERISVIMTEMLEVNAISREKIRGAGISMPGIVNRNEGILVFSPQLGWSSLPIQNIAEEILHLPVVIDNDLKFYAYGECNKGIEGNPNSITFLYIGSGVGAAHVVDGRIFKGAFNSAGEIGHVKIDTHGILCDCGRIGCLQTHMTESSIVNKAKGILSDITSSSEVFEYMERGNQWATNIIMDLINYSAIALGILIAVYDPQVIVLGGEIIEQNSIVFQSIINRYADMGYTPINRNRAIIKSSMQGNSIIFGAAISSADIFLQNHDFSQ